MCQAGSSAANSRPVHGLWKYLLGLNAVFIAIALINALAFRSLAGLELLMWLMACEALLFSAVFVPVFLFHWVWRRQKPSMAAAQSLDALVNGIIQLVP
jgi:membrane protein YdbS with pleckstrin-like domain